MLKVLVGLKRTDAENWATTLGRMKKPRGSSQYIFPWSHSVLTRRPTTKSASGSGLFSSTKAWMIWSCNSHAITVKTRYTSHQDLCCVIHACCHKLYALLLSNRMFQLLMLPHFSFGQISALIADFSLPESKFENLFQRSRFRSFASNLP